MGRLISVVIPAKDAARTIDRQLDALAGQSFAGEWEVVVADNGSADSTRSIVARRAEALRGLRVVDASGRAGPAAARNIGASEARGDRIVFTDADDLVTRDWLAAHAEALDTAAFTTGPVLPLAFDATSLSPRTDVVPARLSHMGFLPYALGTNFGVRSDLFTAAGGFREDRRTGEDVDLSWRLQEDGSELVYVPAAQVGHRAAAGTRQVLRQYFAYGRSDPFLYRDHRVAGIPRERASEVLRSYAGVVLRLLLLFDATQRQRWLHQAGRRAGRLVGSFESRTVYL